MSAEIDSSPIALRSSSYPTHAISRPSHGCLVLRPTAMERVFSHGFMALGLIGVTAFVFDFIFFRTLSKDVWPYFFATGLPAILLLVGLWLSVTTNTFRFDRTANKFVYGGTWSQHVLPLSDIIGIQIVFGGVERNSDSPDYAKFELNLLLNNYPNCRMNLTCIAQLPWTRYAAQELGEFLQVPVVDHVKDGDNRAKSIN